MSLPPRTPRRRIDLVAAAFLAVLGLVLVRLYRIQVAEAEFWRRRAEAQLYRAGGFLPPRGAILDRAGRPLALSVERASLAADPERVEDPARAAAALSPVLDLPAALLEDRLRSPGRFVWIARRLSPEKEAAVRALGLRGLFFRPEYVRIHPNGEAAAHLVGFVGWDGTGLEGIERSFDAALRGSDAYRRVPRDARGRVLPNEALELPAWRGDGKAVRLSIDLLVQTATEEALDDAIRAYRARAASAIVVDPASGEVLALATRPAYDPDDFASVPPERYRNRAIEYAFEPGSTMKPFVLAAARAAGAVPGDAVYFCSGTVPVLGHTIRCHDRHGRVDLARLIAQSCNVGAVHVATALAPRQLHDGLSSLGFGSPTGLPLPGEAAGILRPPAAWSGLTPAMLGIGQEIAVTMPQLVQATTLLAEGGVRRPLRLVLAVGDTPVPAGRADRVLSPAVAREVGGMLVEAVRSGTGRAAAIPGVAVAGKTGTAQVSRPGRGYIEGAYNAVFVGYAPAEAPRVAAAVVVHEPDPEIGYYGGAVAAPVFARIVREGLRVLGALPPAPEEAVQETAPAAAPPHPEDLPPLEVGPNGVRVPDLSGLDLRTAFAWLAENSLRLSAEGEGRIVAQDPPPDSWLPVGGVVRVRLAEAAADYPGPAPFAAPAGGNGTAGGP